ncbi:alpha/beta hydrolase [soil metagenome]
MAIVSRGQPLGLLCGLCLGSLGVVGAGAAAWLALAHCDRRAIAADPEGAALTRSQEGQQVTVRSLDGTQLHAQVFGRDDAPTVVLVHGWMCTSAVWRRQIDELSADFRLVAYDQRGHGQSPPASTGDYSADTLGADLDAVLDQTVPHGERVVVAGHSMGAMAVVAWAEAHPDDVAGRIAGAVLVNVGVERLVRQSTLIPLPASLAALRAAVGERLLAAPLPLPARTNPVLARLVHAVVLGPDASPAQVTFSTKMLLACPTDVRAAFGATLSTFDLAHGLRELTAPTIVVAGKGDRLTPPVHARAIAKSLPDATLVELPGVGHMAPIEAHAEITEVIRGLQTRLSR